MEELTQLLAEAASKLGIEAARLWPQLVLITFVQSLFWSVVCVLVLAIAPWVWLSKFRFAIAHWNDNEAEELLFGTVIILCVLAGIIILALISLPSNLVGVLVPEAVTVMQLVDKLKQ